MIDVIDARERFGKRLCKIRKSQNYTQERLANRVGIAKSTLAHYETGNREPNILTLIKLAQELGVSIDDLVGHEYSWFPNRATGEDESSILDNYRLLKEQGKRYIRQTMEIALDNFKNEDYGKITKRFARMAASSSDNRGVDDEQATIPDKTLEVTDDVDEIDDSDE